MNTSRSHPSADAQERSPDLSGPDGVADGSPWWADAPDCCERCGAEDIDRSGEAYELSGECACDDCAEEIIFENGPFGVGA